MAEQIFTQRIRLGSLFAIYGGLLTGRQRQCLEFYLYDDLSLAEIAAELAVSRQAVHDLLKRSEQLLERSEQKLGLLARSEAEKKILRRAIALLSAADGAGRDEAVAILQSMCDEGR